MRTRRTKIWAAVAATSMLAVVVPVSLASPVGAATADLFFSEYVEGSGNNKALEIYNGTGADVDLTGYRIDVFNNGQTTASNSADLSGSLANDDVYVIANSGADAVVLAASDITSNVTFYNGDDAVVLSSGGVVLDVIGQVGFDPGSEWGVGDVSTGENTIRRLASVCAGDPDGSNPFDPASEWEGFPQNTFDGLGSHTADCGGEPTGPAPGDLVITEVMQNPSAVADGSGEWFELQNVSGFDIDIDGWLISDNDNDSHVIANGSPLVVPAGGALVIGNNADSATNGGASVGYSYGGTMFLSNGADELVLADPTGTEFDRIEWDGGSSWPDPNGASMSLDPQSTDTVMNDDGANWCEASSIFGDGDMGTPGVANDSCGPVVVPCSNAISIASVQGSGDVTPLDGQEVSVRGIVTADGGGEIVIQEAAGGPRSGIVVFSSGNAASIGDEVCVTGLASERFGQTQISGSVDILSNGNALPAPAVVSTATIATGSADAEQWESVLVRVEDVTVSDPDLGFGEFSVDDGSGAVRVDDKYFGFAPAAGQALDYVQGPLSYSFGDFKIEPRDADDIGVPVVVEVCGDPATYIHAIQGSGDASPLVGQSVTIEGVVVGDFQDDVGANGDLNGFFVQEEDADVDAETSTSEGIFVFQGSDPDVDVAIGDVVRVSGSVAEFNGSTQISGVTNVLTCGEGALPAATPVMLPFDSLDDLESVEHMYVTLPQSLAISEYFNFDRFNEIVLTTDRLFQPTAVFDPGTPEAAALADLNDRSKITLDDGRTAQNPDPAIHPNGEVFDLDNRFRGGDLVTNATGVLDYSFGLYRIHPTQGADYTAVNPRTAAPEPVGGNVTVASFNVLNYFNTLDAGAAICGPENNEGCRGADDEDERVRQLTKIVAAIDAIDADVVGIIEVENTTGVEALADIVNGLNDISGPGTYDYLDTGTVGGDVIKVGFIYQPGSVTPVGGFAVLDDPAFVAPRGDGDKNRAALAQTFQDNETGGVFTASVNHLKSKGSGCGDGDDDPEAGSCNLTRTIAAELLASWLAGDPTASGDPDVIIVGDLNSYDKEDPIDALKTAGYADLLDIYQGEFAYSYLFSGELGYLDYAMANMSMAAQVTGATAWHTNSDEPDILDYDTRFKKDAQDALYEPNAYRASDHDAVIVGLDVCDTIAPEIEVMLSETVLSPPNHKYRPVEATVIATDNFDTNPAVRLVSVTSNEADNGQGDGNTVNDIVVLDDDSFLLRAERSGSGSGRTYTITYEVEDDCGNIATATATVVVPLNNGGKNNPS